MWVGVRVYACTREGVCVRVDGWMDVGACVRVCQRVVRAGHVPALVLDRVGRVIGVAVVVVVSENGVPVVGVSEGEHGQIASVGRYVGVCVCVRVCA